MSCFPELTYCVYVDAELPPEELRAVEAHLASCAACREQVEALRAENRLLAAALEEAEAAPAPAVARPMDIVWTAVAVLAAAAGVQVAASWFSGMASVEGTGWLNPLNLGLQLNLLVRGAIYFFDEGVDMLIAAARTISFMTAALGLVGVAAWWLRRRQRLLAGLLLASLALVLAMPAAAVEHRREKRGPVIVKADEVVDDTLVVHAQKVIIEGTVNGNLVAFADGVEINGTVNGDVVCFAGGVNIRGKVDGNVIAFTGGLNLAGGVGQSVYAFAGGTNVMPDARVGGNVTAFTGGLNIDGGVERDVMAFAGATNLSGTVGRNLAAMTDNLSIQPSGRVGRDLFARVEKKENVSIAEGTVTGKTDVKAATPAGSPYGQPKFYLQKALGIAIVFLVGWLLYWLFPALFTAELRSVGDAAKTAGVGFLVLVATPVAACVVGIVLLGIGALADVLLIASLIPVITFMVWLLAVYVSKVFVALLLGRALLRAPAGQPAQFALPLLVGLVLVIVGFNLPYLGKVLHFLVWLLGLGILTLQAYRHYWSRPAHVA